MKTLLSLACLALTTQVAVAERARVPQIKPENKLEKMEKALEQQMKKLALGDSFELSQRKTALPTAAIDRDTVLPKLLSSSQVDRVVKDRVDELEYCWLKIPVAKRSQTSAIVKLSVEAIGIVESVRVEGELPAGVGKCIATVAARWRFPVGDQATEVEYPIGFQQLAAREDIR